MASLESTTSTLPANTTSRGAVPAHLLHILVESAPVAMAMFDDEMRYLVANGRWIEQFQLNALPVIGRTQFEVFPRLHPSWRSVYERCLEGHVERCEDDGVLLPDGTIDWYRWEVRPWRYADGSVGGLIISCEKITRIKRAERQLQFEQDLTRSLVEGQTPLVIADLDGAIRFANPAARTIAATQEQELVGTPFWQAFAADQDSSRLKQILHPTAEEAPEDAGQPLSRAPLPQSFSSSWTDYQGAQHLRHWRAERHRTRAGRVDGLVFLSPALEPSSPFQENTRRSLLESIIHDAQLVPASGAQGVTTAAAAPQPEDKPATPPATSNAAAIVQAAPFGMILLDQEGGIVEANPQVQALLGFPAPIGGAFEDWLSLGAPDEDSGEEIHAEWRELIWRRQLTRCLTLRTSESLLKDIEIRPTPSLPEGHLLLCLSDVTETRSAEEALRASEAKFRALFQDSGIAIALTDPTGDIFNANPAMEKLLRLPLAELRRRSVDSFIAPHQRRERRQLFASLDQEDVRSGELPQLELLCGDDRQALANLHAVLVDDGEGARRFIALFFHDVTTEHCAQTDLRASQEQNRALLEAIPDLILLADPAGLVLDCMPSPRLPIGHEIPPDEPTALADLLPELDPLWPEILAELSHGHPAIHTITSGHGPLECRIARAGDAGIVVVVRPASPAAATIEDPLREAAFELLPQPVLLLDEHATVIDANQAALSGLASGDRPLLGAPLAQVFPLDPASLLRDLATAITSEGIYQGRQQLAQPPGTRPRHVAFVALPLIQGEAGDAREAAASSAPLPGPVLLCQLPDPAQPAQPAPNSQLQQFNHRFKNHLQIIGSLINLQLQSLQDAPARDALRATQSRVRAIAFLHQQLFKSDAGPDIEPTTYIGLLVDHLRQVYQIDPARISVEATASGDSLPLDRAVPVALVLNELVANAMRHAFPDHMRGKLSISLTATPSQIIVAVADDGIGLPQGDGSQRRGLGLRIVEALASQASGQLTIEHSPLTRLTVTWPLS
jgi:PAS domain S-box-containing protein